MISKQTSRFILLLAGLLALWSCAEPGHRPSPSGDGEGLLWRIESEAATPSYLFGTIHSEDRRVLALPQRVKEAFARSDIFAMEVVLDRQARERASRAMYSNEGRQLAVVADEALFQRVVAALAERGLDADHVAMLKPWAAFTILSTPPAKTGVFLDHMLQRRALAAGKEVTGLEPIEEQLAVLDGMSVADQLGLLESALEQQQDFQERLEQTIEIYLSQDLQAMLDLYEHEFMGIPDKGLAERLKQRILIDRNQRMFSRMQSLLARGGAFIAVGALHLPGEQGLLQLLQQAGYRLNPVY